MIKKNIQFAVLGLGRFGLSVVETLSQYDVNVFACDSDPARLHLAVDYATHLLQVDVSDESAMAKIGLGNFDVVILAMGEDLESSIMATMMAKEHGAKFVMVKARGPRQKKILESIGADQVILPEFEMGVKVARKLISPNIIDVLEESEHYSISEIRPMAEWLGKSIRQADVRRKHGTTVLGIRYAGKMHVPAPADHVLAPTDILIVLNERETIVEEEPKKRGHG